MNFDKLRNIEPKIRQNCITCSRPLGRPTLNLPKLPLTEFYTDQKIEPIGFSDQEFHYCENCGQGQLSRLVPSELLYADSYVTRTSTSHSAKWAISVFKGFIEKNTSTGPTNCLIDIGCNDVYLLQEFQPKVKELWGIDPILKNFGSKNLGSINLIGDFVENVNLGRSGIKPDVVVSSHTLEHITDPKLLLSNLFEQTPDHTLFCFQFPGLEGLVKDARFDQVYHQHYNYFTVDSVRHLLHSLGAELISYEVNPYHWAALMVAFRKTPKEKRSDSSIGSKPILTKKKILTQFDMFRKSMEITQQRIHENRDERLYGYGAALMLPILNYHLEGELLNLQSILDQDVTKIGKYYINVPVQVVDPQTIQKIEDTVIVLTATMSLDAGRKIIPNLMQKTVRKIIVPLNVI